MSTSIDNVYILDDPVATVPSLGSPRRKRSRNSESLSSTSSYSIFSDEDPIAKKSKGYEFDFGDLHSPLSAESGISLDFGTDSNSNSLGLLGIFNMQPHSTSSSSFCNETANEGYQLVIKEQPEKVSSIAS